MKKNDQKDGEEKDIKKVKSIDVINQDPIQDQGLEEETSKVVEVVIELDNSK